MRLDRKDVRLLDLLAKNAKLTVSELAEELELPATTVHNRIKRLEKAKVIRGYNANIDYEHLDKSVVAYVMIGCMHMLPNGMRISQEDIAKHVSDISGIEEVNSLTGLNDMIAKVRVKNVRELNEVIVKSIRTIDGVEKTHTMIVLNSY